MRLPVLQALTSVPPPPRGPWRRGLRASLLQDAETKAQRRATFLQGCVQRGLTTSHSGGSSVTPNKDACLCWGPSPCKQCPPWCLNASRLPLINILVDIGECKLRAQVAPKPEESLTSLAYCPQSHLAPFSTHLKWTQPQGSLGRATSQRPEVLASRRDSSQKCQGNLGHIENTV
jgi:hypothetical protein